ncbi:MAG: vWA domain-containing protein [Mycobacterium sp.]
MTDSTKTLIAALLDRSGSMQRSKAATEDGWSELINGQRAEQGSCEVTLAQFDSRYEVLYPPTDIAAVPEFIVNPRGSTALLDATGRFITEVGERLAALPEEQRPGTVICLIMTDGMENASRQWSWDGVKRLITQQREVYGWEFIFLGANIDAVEVGMRMGVDADSALTFASDSYHGNREAYRVTSVKMGYARMQQKRDFSAADRDAAMGKGDDGVGRAR